MTRSRRAFLRATGAAAAVAAAGCAARDEETDATPTGTTGSATERPADDPTPAATPRDGAWRSYRGDARNTGTGDAGPAAEPTTVWARATAVAPGGPPAAGAGVVVVPGEADTVYARQLSDGNLAWSRSVPVDVDTRPAVTETAAVVADGRRVTALAPDDGTRLWSREHAAAVVGLTAAGDSVLVATRYGVSSLAAATGERRWRVTPDGEVTTAAAAGDPVAVGVRRRGQPTVVAVGPDGTAWRQSFPGAVPDDDRPGLWRPTVADDAVAVAGGETLASLSAADGSRAWQTTTAAPVAAPPAVGAFGVATASLETDPSVTADETAAGTETVTPPPTDVMRLRVTLAARRPDDGGVRWQRRYRGSWNFTSGPPQAVPLRATADRLLLPVDARLYAVGPDGAPQWTAEAAGAPAVGDGAVTTGETAISLDDGRAVWRATGGHGGVRGTPAVVGNRVFVGSDDGLVSALAADTGRVDWRVQLDGPVGTTPAVTAPVDGRRLAVVGTRAGSVYGLAVETGSVVWRRVVGGSPQSPTVADGRVFLGTFTETLTALSAATGEVAWETTRPEPFLPREPAVADSVVVCGANGRLYAFETGDGSERWRVTADADYLVQSTPVIADGLAVLTHGPVLRAFDLRDGTERWRIQTGATNTPPAVHDGTVYTVVDGTLTAVAVTDGREQWSQAVGKATSVTATPECLVVRGLEVPLRGFDHDGELLWEHDGRRTATDPAVTDGWLFAGAAGGRLLALGDPDN